MPMTSRIARWLERLAWSLGLVLLAAYAGARIGADIDRVRGLAAFEDARAAQSAIPAGPEPPPDVTQRRIPASLDQSLWSTQRIRAYTAVAADAAPPLAALRIPALELAVPVYDEADERNLDRGAIHIRGTAPLAPLGNIGIAAHRDGFFRKLKDIELDDELYVDTVDGTLLYRVVEISVVTPRDVHVLESTAVPSVTLVTCFPFYFVGDAPERYIVRAELAGAVQAAASPARSVFDEETRSSRN